jgi:peptidoglycan/xylan/chitin deacetylase (PgdA/CDA1 family)
MTAARPLLAHTIDVDTLRGTLLGVPRLAKLLARAGAGATFLFSVGPDHTGRAIRRAFRPGFVDKVSRTSVLEHYGLRTLLYGTLLPGPHIGRSCAVEMRAIESDGFEVGLHAYDHVRWQDFVAGRDARWTRREIGRGIEAFRDVFGKAPAVHGAAGWQMNDFAFALEESAGFEYASDTRGTHPFRPVVAGRQIQCPQLPTTLPTLDELIGVDGMSADDAAVRLLEATRDPPPHGHVYTLHAELEGMRLEPVLIRLLAGWRSQGYELVAMRRVLDATRSGTLPAHRVVAAGLAGRSGRLMMQGPAVAPVVIMH